MANNKTFLKITNKDIFDRIERFEDTAEKRFDILEKHAEQTNGRVLVNEVGIKNNNQIIKWTIRTIALFAIAVVGWLVALIV